MLRPRARARSVATPSSKVKIAARSPRLAAVTAKSAQKLLLPLRRAP